MSEISVGNALIEVRHDWTEFKEVLSSKGLLLQYAETPTYYSLFALESSVAHTCVLSRFPGTSIRNVPDTSQEDLTEFETLYADDANKPLEARSPDGRLVTRVTVASPGSHTHRRNIGFTSATPNSLVCKRLDDTDYDDVTMRLLDANGDETTTPSEAVITEVDFEAPYVQELVGGGIYFDPSICGLTGNDWWVAAVAVPTIPEELGGSVQYVTKACLEILLDPHIHVDGRSTQYLVPDPTYHTSLIRFRVWHPAGAAKRFLAYLETFK